MLEKLTDPRDVRLWEGRIPVRHRYTPGVAGEAFFEALRDGRFVGSPCRSCDITYCPPRLFCERCFAELAAETEVGPGGTVESFTVGYVDADGEPLEEPVTVGLVRLDGADTVLLHFLVEFETPGIGDRAEAVFRRTSQRTGSIHDLLGFRPSRRSARRPHLHTPPQGPGLAGTLVPTQLVNGFTRWRKTICDRRRSEPTGQVGEALGQHGRSA